MTDLLQKLLDLPRELRLGTTWLVVSTFVIAADFYALVRFESSLLRTLERADAFMAAPARPSACCWSRASMR